MNLIDLSRLVNEDNYYATYLIEGKCFNIGNW